MSPRRVLVVPFLVLAAACGSSSTGATTATPAGPTTAPAGEVACDWEPAPADTGNRKPGLPPADAPTTGTATVTMKTNQGTVVFTMDRAKTPCTAASFTWLASKKFFDSTPCPRVTDPGQGLSILQCGDPAGNGSGGPGYTIPDEDLTGATYPAGAVAIANSGSAHTGGSQFFLVYEKSRLPPLYTPFGTVTSGLDVLTTIAKAGNDGTSPAGGGKPALATTIESFTVSG